MRRTRRTFLAASGGMLLTAAVAPAAFGAPRLTLRQRVQTHNAEVAATLFTGPQPIYPFEGIVVHHTATRSASLEGVSRYHSKRFDDPLGIQYHFLIQNGRRGKPTGWIEVGRWAHQVPAIHLFRPTRAVESVAICLVGNFEEARPHPWMTDALVTLCQPLVTRLGIRAANVTTHTGVDGRLTQCPGKHFSVERLRKRLTFGPA